MKDIDNNKDKIKKLIGETFLVKLEISWILMSIDATYLAK